MPSPEQTRVWRLFLEAHAAVTDLLARELRDEEDLPLSWYDVLVHLHEADGCQLRMQDLAGAVLLSKSGVTRLVDRMEAAGLVERAACATDRRVTWARLTPAGEERFLAVVPSHVRSVERHFLDHLAAEDLPVLERALAAVGEAAFARRD